MRRVRPAILLIGLVVAASLVGAALEHRYQLFGSFSARQQDGPERLAPALAHAIQHLDPGYVCPMHPQIVREQPGECPICGMGLVRVEVSAAQGPQAHPVVEIAPAVINQLGVRTATVERQTLWRRIDTVGYVEYDRTRLRHIYAPAEGNVDKLAISSEGERVTKGQFLFEVFSPMLSGSNDETYADWDGVVVDLNVIEGSYIDVTTRMLTLADLSSVWIVAEVFEEQASWVEVGQAAEVRLPYLPGRRWEGRVEYIYPNLDPETRTLKVRLRFDNPDEALRPNMHAEVTLYGGGRKGLLAVPREAVIRTGSQTRVVVALGEGRFQPREIVAGLEAGAWVEITEGLALGERVVVSAQFLIDSESSLKASLRRLGG